MASSGSPAGYQVTAADDGRDVCFAEFVVSQGGRLFLASRPGVMGRTSKAPTYAVSLPRSCVGGLCGILYAPSDLRNGARTR